MAESAGWELHGVGGAVGDAVGDAVGAEDAAGAGAGDAAGAGVGDGCACVEKRAKGHGDVAATARKWPSEAVKAASLPSYSSWPSAGYDSPPDSSNNSTGGVQNFAGQASSRKEGTLTICCCLYWCMFCMCCRCW